MLACALALVPPGILAQPTPTPAPQDGGTLWKGTIDSQTRRQYTHDGATLNTCETDWITTIYFVLSPEGKINGSGEADLNAAASCSPHPLAGNAEKLMLNLSGQGDSSAINLQIDLPDSSSRTYGDFGGFTSLAKQAVCQDKLRSLVIPLNGSDSASVRLDFTANMDRCKGASQDSLSSDNQISLSQVGDCAALPAEAQNSPEASLCGPAGG